MARIYGERARLDREHRTSSVLLFRSVFDYAKSMHDYKAARRRGDGLPPADARNPGRTALGPLRKFDLPACLFPGDAEFPASFLRVPIGLSERMRDFTGRSANKQFLFRRIAWRLQA